MAALTDKIEAVQRMQNFIEQNYFEEITPADLAKAAHFSPWHSARLFKELTGLTPADYIRRLRLSKSALRIRDEGVKITEIAFAMGFSSVDGYQRAFRREFGCNPKQYAQSHIPLQLFTPYGVKYYNALKKENQNMENVKNIFIQLIKKPARKIIIKRGRSADNYLDYCEEVGCDVWGVLTSTKSISGEPVCLWLPEKYQKANTSSYVQGVEVSLSYSGAVPEGFEAIELPEADYLMFQGEPFAEEDYCNAIDSLQLAIEKYNPSAIGCEWDEENPQIQLEPIGTRGYIELKAVKKKA